MPPQDCRGTLYEIPILIFVLAISFAIAGGQHTWGRRAAGFIAFPAVCLLVFFAASGIFWILDLLERRRLRRGLKSAAVEDRRKAARTLAQRWELKTEVPFLIEALGDADAETRLQAAIALAKTGAGADGAVPVLAQALKSAGEDRREAADALGKFGQQARAAVGALIESAKDKGWGGRWSAMVALGEIGPAAKEALPLLIETLGDPDQSLAGFAATAIGGIGPEARDAVGALIGALKEARGMIRANAISSLGHIGPAAAPAVPQLIQILKEEKGWCRMAAIRSLREIGGAAREAVPALREIASGDDELNRDDAGKAAKAISAGAP